MTTTISEIKKDQQITSVRCTSTSPVLGVYLNGPLNNGVGATITTGSPTLTVDSVLMEDTNRVLLRSQGNSYENGIYVVSGVGDDVVLTRSADFQNINQMQPGGFIITSAGNTNAGAIFTIVEPQVANVGENAPIIGSSTIAPTEVSLSQDGLNVLSLGVGYLRIKSISTLTATRVFNIDGGDSDRTFSIESDVSISSFMAGLLTSTQGSEVRDGIGFIGGGVGPFAGGSSTHIFSAPGVTPSAGLIVSIINQTNSTYIVRYSAGVDTLTVDFSGDPGPNTFVSYGGFL